MEYIWGTLCAFAVVTLSSMKFAFSSKWKLVDERVERLDKKIDDHLVSEDKRLGDMQVHINAMYPMILEIWKKFADNKTEADAD